MRILEVSTVPLNENGISRFLLRTLSAMNRENLAMDFACFSPPTPSIAEEIAALEGRFHLLPPRNRQPWAYFAALTRLLRREQYDVLHVHGNSATMAVELWAARFAGTRVRIAHSHNTMCVHTRLNAMLQPLLRAGYTIPMACSQAAGRWLFGNHDFVELKNGVDTASLAFSSAARDEIRREFGLEGSVAIGMVAGFVPAKNHAFALRAFAHALRIHPHCRLILVGEGPLLADIRAMATQLELSDKVLFSGIRNDVPRLLSALDAAILPSLHEGLPAAALEYQCAGLPALLSDAITPEAAPTFLAQRLPLQEDAWAEAMAHPPSGSREADSRQAIAEMQRAGYSLDAAAESLRQVYLSAR